jgi:hypothetical protein
MKYFGESAATKDVDVYGAVNTTFALFAGRVIAERIDPATIRSQLTSTTYATSQAVSEIPFGY